MQGREVEKCDVTRKKKRRRYAEWRKCVSPQEDKKSLFVPLRSPSPQEYDTCQGFLALMASAREENKSIHFEVKSPSPKYRLHAPSPRDGNVLLLSNMDMLTIPSRPSLQRFPPRLLRPIRLSIPPPSPSTKILFIRKLPLPKATYSSPPSPSFPSSPLFPFLVTQETPREGQRDDTS